MIVESGAAAAAGGRRIGALSLRRASAWLGRLDHRAAPALWMLVALAARVAMLRDVRRVDADGQRYLIYAGNISHGDFFHPALNWAPYPPFYPLLCSLVGRTGLSLVASGYIVSMVCGVALVGVLFALARYTLGAPAAHITALLAALNGHLIVYSDAVLSESTYYFLAFAAIFVVLRYLLPPTGGEVASRPHAPLSLLVFLPLLVVAITLTRYIGLVLAVALLVTALVVAGRRASRALLASLVLAIIVGGAALTGVSAATQARLTQVTGPPAGNYATQELSHGLHDGFYAASELRGLRETGMTESPLRYFRDNARLIAKRALLLGRNDLETGILTGRQTWNGAPIVPLYLAILGALGVYWLLGATAGGRTAAALILPPVLLVIPNSVFDHDPRYYMALLPPLLMFVAYAVARIAAAQRPAGWPSILRWGLLALVAALYLTDLYYIHPN